MAAAEPGGIILTAAGSAAPAVAAGDGLLVLGRYRLHRRLGSGGFGIVWEARDERLDRDVAVKILPRERIVGGRFEREARAAARLSHPAIVTLYEAGADDDGAYLVSELVRGATFDELQSSGRLSDRDIVRIGVALCDALEHAHAAGVVHRDVKPSNVLVPDRPVTPAHPAKLTDFGVARVVGGDSLTRTGDVVGTAAYMAPEQAAGREAGAPADLYALALVLYEALTGLNPVRSGSAAQQARRLGAHLPPLRRQRRELPRELGRSIDMALRPRPRERGTIAELRQGLLVALPEAGDTPGVVAAPWRSRRTTDDDHNHDHHHDPQSEREPEVAIAWADPDHGEPAEDEAGHKLRARATRLERVLGAGAAAALAAWAATHVLTPAPIAPAAVALVAAGAVLVAPRIGWLTLTAAFAALAAGQHHPGMAMLVLIAGLIAPLASPRRGAAWPLPSGAAALGAIGLATAWPALAARARTPWHRAGIAAAGWGWVVLLSAGAHTTARPAAVVWGASAYATWHDLLVPIVTSGALVTAAIWAGAAVLAPYLVRGRRIAVDAVRTVVWAAVLASATGMTHGATLRPGPAFGAVVAAAVILAPGLLGELRGREVLAGAKP